MKRSESLGADPDKTRDWQRRSRATAARKARDRPRKPLKRTRAVARPLAPIVEAPLPPVRFKAPVPAYKQKCIRCDKRAEGYHHWLPQQAICVYVRGLRLPDADARKLLRRLLNDPANLAAMCHREHLDHENGVRRLSGEEVPHEARLFALKLGPEWAERLYRMYPGGQRP